MRSEIKINSELVRCIEENDVSTALQLIEPPDIWLYFTNTDEYLIHVTARKGFPDLTRRLLGYGANPYQLNQANENALSIAQKKISALNRRMVKTSDREKYDLLEAQRSDFMDVIREIYLSNCEITSGIGAYIIEAVKADDTDPLKAFLEKMKHETRIETIRRWHSKLPKLTPDQTKMAALLHQYKFISHNPFAETDLSTLKKPTRRAPATPPKQPRYSPRLSAYTSGTATTPAQPPSYRDVVARSTERNPRSPRNK